MIEREEFIAIILPQMKLEIITNERNFDDLRRLFKQFDTDQNNFLEKREFREALNHLGINLSDV
jgi:Ca2+-binding EF-hand superfamily protein